MLTTTHHARLSMLLLHPCLQARIAALLKENPAAGQSFCRMLVAPFIHYMDSGKGGEPRLNDIVGRAQATLTAPNMAANVNEHPLCG